MSILRTSSGDVSVDRRLDYAELMCAENDFGAACEILEDAMSRVPDWVAGWVRLGEIATKAGKSDRAKEAFEKALALDPADHFGASLRLDLLRPVSLTDRSPAAHVASLFDQYAAKFETSLVQKLGYRVPELLASVLPEQLGKVLDLGCGTGLMGQAIEGRFSEIIGYDLSKGMLAEARRKGIYQRLEQKDLLALELTDERFDLIVAADVFIYIGALERVISWVADALAPNGIFAFTVEEGHEKGYTLLESHRYAHSESYLRGMLEAAGFGSFEIRATTLRKDRGADVRGLVVIAQGVRRAHDSAGEDFEFA